MTPIDMVLHCPKCGLQHIDAPDEPSNEFCLDNTPMPPRRLTAEPWTNPPHRSHLCHACGHLWRPADVPTNGVAALQTKGKNDSPAVARNEDSDRLDFLEKTRMAHVLAIGKTWYSRTGYGMPHRVMPTLRAAIDSQRKP